MIGKGLTFEAGLQKVTLIGILSYVIIAIAPFYKALMDKIGRRPIFIINTFGMTLGMVVCWISPNFICFAVGLILIKFFTAHDMQMIYVYEVAPPKWRSVLYFTCKFIGVFGTLAIPLLRSVYVHEDGSGWRMVYLIPAIIGFIIFLMTVFMMRESDVFVKNRIQNIKEKSDVTKKQEKKSGIFPAIKYIWRDGQLRWLGISIVVIGTSLNALTAYYESFLSTQIETSAVTESLYFQPFAMATVYLISGFLSDWLGRKKATGIFAITAIASFVAFIVFADKASPLVLGILLGVFIGAFWNITDLNAMMFAESSPTEIRGSISGTQALLFGIGTLLSTVICSILLSFLPLYGVMILVGIPGILFGTILTLLKVRETKGTDLEKVKYAEKG